MNIFPVIWAWIWGNPPGRPPHTLPVCVTAVFDLTGADSVTFDLSATETLEVAECDTHWE